MRRVASAAVAGMMAFTTQPAWANDDHADLCPTYPHAEIAPEELEARAQAELTQVRSFNDAMTLLYRHPTSDAARQLRGRQFWVLTGLHTRMVHSNGDTGEWSMRWTRDQNGDTVRFEQTGDRPSTESSRYQYNRDGTVRQERHGRFVRRYASYHANGRPRAAFDNDGRMLCMDWAGNITATYRLDDEPQLLDRFSYQYDGAGRLVLRQFPGSATTYTYVGGSENVAQETVTADNGSIQITTHEYDGSGSLVRVVTTMQDGPSGQPREFSTETISYDDRGNRIGRRVTTPGGVDLVYRYTFDVSGNEIGESMENGAESTITESTFEQRTFAFPRLRGRGR